MSEPNIPDEILHHILNYLLAVDESLFCRFPSYDRTYGRGCYRSHSEWEHIMLLRQSSLLLVSKRWLRVGTPLLYRGVVIWKAEHTKTLARLFKANPAIGAATRYLRLEGGLGKDLHDVARMTPNVHTLYLNISIRGTESIAGLRRALPILKLSKLYLTYMSYAGESKVIREGRELVEKCLTHHLVTLRTIILPQGFRMSTSIAVALGNAPALETVSASSEYYNITDWLKRGYIQLIATNPRLQRICCRGARGKPAVDDMITQMGVPERIANLFTYERTYMDDIRYGSPRNLRKDVNRWR
ncbi:uncharacterized protein PHACADRAFT_106695 [Phanerochaete carnosa HHB-10118-sp]|uniref:Uncharacterized protein n=1 Tax=Phanerochaete carnosa (strain HHB-10118-sp) TaxID=650164 RepID=K5UJD9_PHACS|nr:uncharacterized protein PHACADRAFT_106695 [Phanerochaete carnosa HHB-10118-sp]EKM49681.1 hypothetical protein PHACADRAFT_106695 [Phanerochaete carnosa HHB-10118-sp]